MPVSLSVVLVVAFQEILTFASKQALVIVSSLNFEENMGRSRGNFHANDEDPTQRFALFFHKIDFLNVTVFVLFSSSFGVGSLCLELLPFP